MDRHFFGTRNDLTPGLQVIKSQYEPTYTL